MLSPPNATALSSSLTHLFYPSYNNLIIGETSRTASKTIANRSGEVFDLELLFVSRTTLARAVLVLVLVFNVAREVGPVDKTALDGGAVDDDGTNSASVRPLT